MIRVEAPHFVAGFVTNGTVIVAAPILRYMIGWEDVKVRQYCHKKGWKASVVPPRKL